MNAHIAKIIDVDPYTIGIYINSYKQNGVNGLDVEGSSRSGLLSKDEEKKLYEIITTKTPDQVGFWQPQKMECKYSPEMCKR